MKKVIFIFALPIIILGCSTQNPNPNINSTCTTSNYPTVVIGGQVWMQKNLDVERYRNGDIIPQVTDSIQWKNLRTGAWCYYDNDPANCDTYGKLYNGFAVNDPRGLAPVGWHVSSLEDWNKLIKFIDINADTTCKYCVQSLIAGGSLKEMGLNHWLNFNIGGTNSSGFTGIPGGKRGGGWFAHKGELSQMWTSTQDGQNYNFLRVLYDTSQIASSYMAYDLYGFSVRCVKD